MMLANPLITIRNSVFQLSNGSITKPAKRFITLNSCRYKVDACTVYGEDHKEIQKTLKKVRTLVMNHCGM